MGKEMEHTIFIKYLDGSLDKSEKEKFENRLKTDVNFEHEFKTYEKIWNMSREVSAFEILSDDLKINENKNHLRTLKQYLKVAAVFLFLIAGGFTIRYFISSNGNIVHVVEATDDVIQKVTLPDNSIVYLKKGSEITFNNSKFNKENRKVKFKGDGFFVVAETSTIPFTIDLNNAVIVVTGTEFSVREQADSVLVVLEKGSVNCFSKTVEKEKISLVAGQKAILKTNTAKKIVDTVEIPLIYWKKQYLVFENSDLNDVLISICEKYNVTLVEKNPVNKQKKLTGIFYNESINEVIVDINQVLEIELELVNDTLFYK